MVAITSGAFALLVFTKLAACVPLTTSVETASAPDANFLAVFGFEETVEGMLPSAFAYFSRLTFWSKSFEEGRVDVVHCNRRQLQRWRWR